ncbi:MAG: DNA repair protein RecO [Oscillospiraceae bacterium]|nr:DNA repair protein RecO [Oscillospiraceae bacterium]MCR4647391.1 DNA repair protein RecO [Oscillospiraceae bacterium]
MLNVKGVVLSQTPVGEQDRFIDILTAEYGVIEVLVKGAAKITSKTGSATQLFAYSQFSLADKKHGRARILNSVSPIHIFYGLRSSVPAVALASYFSQIIGFSVLPRAGTPELLRLMLNSLHYLSEGTYPTAHIKAVFELRAASLLGFMPDVVMCRTCGTYLPAELSFSVEGGYFCCKDCRPAESMAHWIDMRAASLQAVRHIVLSDFEKIYAFRLGELAQEPLYAFAEAFLQYHIDRHFQTLDFYKVVSGGK